MSAHTPGPWEIYRPESNHECPGIKADGVFIVVFGEELTLEEESGVQGNTVAEAKANARLIAAAPKMYSLLERLAKLSNGLNNSSSSAEYMAAQLADEAHRFISQMTGVAA